MFIYKENLIEELSKTNFRYMTGDYIGIIGDINLASAINSYLLNNQIDKHKTFLNYEQALFFSKIPLARYNKAYKTNKIFLDNVLTSNYCKSFNNPNDICYKNIFSSYLQEIAYIKVGSEQIYTKLQNIISIFKYKFEDFIFYLYNELSKRENIDILASLFSLDSASKYGSKSDQIPYNERYEGAKSYFYTLPPLKIIDLVFDSIDKKKFGTLSNGKPANINDFLSINLDKMEFSRLGKSYNKDESENDVQNLNYNAKLFYVDYRDLSNQELIDQSVYEKISHENLSDFNFNELIYLFISIINSLQTSLENCFTSFNFQKSKMFTDYFNAIYTKVRKLENGVNLAAENDCGILIEFYLYIQIFRKIAIFEDSVFLDINENKFGTIKQVNGQRNIFYSYNLQNALMACGTIDKNDPLGIVKGGILNCYKFMTDWISHLVGNTENVNKYDKLQYFRYIRDTIIHDGRKNKFRFEKAVVNEGLPSEVLSSFMLNEQQQFVEINKFVLRNLRNAVYMLRIIILKDFVYNNPKDVERYYLNFYSTMNRLINCVRI